jgi:hypothetical protein
VPLPLYPPAHDTTKSLILFKTGNVSCPFHRAFQRSCPFHSFSINDLDPFQARFIGRFKPVSSLSAFLTSTPTLQPDPVPLALRLFLTGFAYRRCGVSRNKCLILLIRLRFCRHIFGCRFPQCLVFIGRDRLQLGDVAATDDAVMHLAAFSDRLQLRIYRHHDAGLAVDTEQHPGGCQRVPGHPLRCDRARRAYSQSGRAGW